MPSRYLALADTPVNAYYHFYFVSFSSSLASSDLLHAHLPLAGTRFDYDYCYCMSMADVPG